MTTIRKIFLASSAELEDDRQAFELFIGRKNKDWIAKGVFLEAIVWKDFLDAVSRTRLQDEYNRAIRECDLFVMLFFSKVGCYTEEEFETAFGQFKATNKPLIFTYFKNAPIPTGSANPAELQSLWAFKNKLKALGHFETEYQNSAELLLHFDQQLDKLAASGFIELHPQQHQTASPGGTTDTAKLNGSGAIAQGKRATAVGAGGVLVRGSNTGNINTGTQINSPGLSVHDLEALFAPLLAAVARLPPGQQAAAVQQVQELKTEVAKGQQADDSRIGKLVDGLAALVPGAVKTLLSTFATPILGGIAGPVTKYVLDKLKGS